MLNRKNLLLNVYGKVQGVFFRASAMEIANSLGVNGTVRNVDDGCVQFEVEGTKEQLDELIKWCSHGPANAVVSEIKIEEGELKNFIDFRIVR